MPLKKRILFWGELPPDTVHGISLSNHRILEALSEEFEIIKVQDRASFGGGLQKLFSFVTSLILLFLNGLKKFDVFYVNAPMSRLGLRKVLIAVRVILLVSPKTKVVSHLHRGDFLDFISDDNNRGLFTQFAGTLNRILVLSETSKEELIASDTISSDKVALLHNTIKPVHCYEGTTDTSDFSCSQRYLYCLCNYIESKRIHNLVSVANQLSFPIMFNGTASSEQYMERLKTIDGSSLCSFDGVIHGEDKELKLNKAKALILPSLNEGMPLVILESLAQGTPVICYDVGFISDYLGEDYPGLVREPSDEALKTKIQWLEELSDADYQSLRERSYHLFWDNFDPSNINNNALRVFSEL